jgi:hypothetical protein
MTTPTLERLKATYSSALYAYFRVTNLANSCHKFLQDPTKPPVFRYKQDASEAMANRRLRKLQNELQEIGDTDEAATAFLQWRIAETKLLRKFWHIKENKHSVNVERLVEKYVNDQIELYGPLDARIFGGIIKYLRVLAHHKGHEYSKEMEEIEKSLGEHPDDALFSPREETFLHYKHLYNESFPEMHHVFSGIREAQKYTTEQVVNTFERALESIGADRHGWEVEVVEGGANVSASKYRRKIIIGRHFKPTSTIRFKQIVAHEVGCHALRAMTDSESGIHAGFDENDEGLAIVVEQLFAKRFMYKRAARYLAVGLAIGIDGKKRNFCEVYDILWRVMYITGGDKEQAKEQAFYETARTFRGGITSVPGMAYIKDKIYLESNLLIWEKLEEQQLDIKAFKGLFKGHNSILAKEIVP